MHRIFSHVIITSANNESTTSEGLLMYRWLFHVRLVWERGQAQVDDARWGGGVGEGRARRDRVGDGRAHMTNINIELHYNTTPANTEPTTLRAYSFVGNIVE